MSRIRKTTLTYPAGSNTQIQFNNNGVFGAVPMYWNGSEVSLGVNDAGYDFKLFGETSGRYLLWDASADLLEVSGSIKNTATYSLSTGTFNLINLSPTIIATGSANVNFYKGGTTFSSNDDNTGTISTMNFELTKSGGGKNSNLAYVNQTLNVTGSGESTNVYFSKMYLNKIGTGQITNIYGNYFEIRNGNATNKITNAYANYVKTPSNTGTIDNFYGLYFEDIINATNNYSIYTNAGLVHFGDNVEILAKNIITDTTTGLKLGTATSQKLAVYGKTPVVQQSALTTVDASTVNSGDATTDTVINNMRTRINELETRLSTYGWLP